MKNFSILLIISFLISCTGNINQDSLRVIPQGELVGVNAENDTFSWKGIPFAAPPIGNLRWKAPETAAPWEGTYEAVDFKDECFQREIIFAEETFLGSEDCLYLNVWTPKFSNADINSLEKPLPVMMWIHGGGNVVGDAKIYDPSSLVSSQNVIVVTIQYRMGPFGWFRHPALVDNNSSLEDRSGNFGTLDTISALKWIKANIKFFGGDPNNVTIFGESAGGHNVTALFASPLASGLFHKAIVQSGVSSVSSIEASENYLPSNKSAPTDSGLEILNKILVSRGIAEDVEAAKTIQMKMSKSEKKDFLYSATSEELVTALLNDRPEQVGMTRVFPDGHVILKGGFAEAYSKNTINKVPIIFGTNKDENKFFNSANPNFVEWAPAKGLFRTAGIDQMPVKIIDPDYYDAINFYGSGFWKNSAVDTPARILVENGHEQTFAYRFDWDELREVNGVDLSRLVGAAHALEILFVMGTFDNFIIKSFLFGRGSFRPALELSSNIQSYWAEFAYTGNPGRGTNNALPLWKKWSNEGEKYLILDSTLDKGIKMSDEEYTVEFLLDRLSKDSRLSDIEKCETLFGISYDDGSGVSENVFNNFLGGICKNLDYTKTIEIINAVRTRLTIEDQEET